MVVEIDFQKAYDRLNWDFVGDTLHDVGIPRNIMELIWHCILSTSIKVLWNGKSLEDFAPSIEVFAREIHFLFTCRGSLQVCLHLSGTKLLINGALEEAVRPKKKNGVLACNHVLILVLQALIKTSYISFC